MSGRLASRRAILILSTAVALYFLYLFGLTRTGLVGPDEPRYAAIGRAMAATGDWVTPRLWGSPWFEKPALLYWMTAAAFKIGLGPDLAPRLPVALAGILFLIYFFALLCRAFGRSAAWYSAAILATSAGWLAYSHIAVTDLPMSAAFAAAMLTLCLESGTANAALLAGGFLGLAVMAKGLVPLALFIPALWFLRHRIRDLALASISAIVVAAPWYALVTLRNGAPFLNEFIWKQHFGRFLTSALQHPQPFWFYLPILLAALFPWTPLIVLPMGAGFLRERLARDARTQFLLAWFLWGFLFFSASRNKLPGYLLPLLPPVAALIGIAVSDLRSRSPKLMSLIAASVALFCLVQPLESALPQLLIAGLSHTPLPIPSLWIIPALLLAFLAAWCEKIGHREFAFAIATVGTVFTVVTMVWLVYPQLDRQVSGRAIWVNQGGSVACVPPTTRSQHYSIDYYAGRDLPDCK